jgi:prepilin peptidase CpaA
VENLPLPLVVVFAASLVAAVTDVWKFKVHNAVTLPLLLVGLLYHAAIGGLWGTGWVPGLLNGLAGAGFGFAILFAFYILGGMGGGDVKLMAAIGAWLGLMPTFFVFLAASLAAGVYAVVLIVAGGRLAETSLNIQALFHRLRVIGRHLGADDRVEEEVGRSDRRGRVIPFAVMIAVGVGCLVLLSIYRPH